MIEMVSSFKDRFNKALSIRNIKPADLAKKTNISESTISQYRSGYAKPKEPKLVLLSEALDVNPVWLMGLNVPMDIYDMPHIETDLAVSSLSHSEKKLVLAFRNADVVTRKNVLKLLDAEE